MENVAIKLYDSSREAEMLSDIAAFWKTHYLTLTPEEAAAGYGDHRRTDLPHLPA